MENIKVAEGEECSAGSFMYGPKCGVTQGEGWGEE